MRGKRATNRGLGGLVMSKMLVSEERSGCRPQSHPSNIIELVLGAFPHGA